MANGKAAGKRTIRQHCTPCDKEYDMEVVDGAENTGDVVWLKCPGCQGFLPYMKDEEGNGEAGGANEDGEVELAPEDFTDAEKEQAREYDEAAMYKVGDVIYHRSWNDYGKVIGKEELPGNRKTVIVNFGHQGKIRLLEGVT